MARRIVCTFCKRERQPEEEGWRHSASIRHQYGYGNSRRYHSAYHCPQEACRPSRLADHIWDVTEEREQHGYPVR